MPEERDFDRSPYSRDEQRVADYLHALKPDIGTVDDPIRFLIGQHAALAILAAERREADAQRPTNAEIAKFVGVFDLPAWLDHAPPLELPDPACQKVLVWLRALAGEP